MTRTTNRGAKLFICLCIITGFVFVLGTNYSKVHSATQQGELVKNGDFEIGGTQNIPENWQMNTGFRAQVTTDNPTTEGIGGNREQTFHAHISSPGTLITSKLFQDDIQLKPGTKYRLRFMAKSNTGEDMEVSLVKSSFPYPLYTAKYRANLSNKWKVFSGIITAPNLRQEDPNSRLRFLLHGNSGSEYWIDKVSLVEVSENSNSANTPTEARGFGGKLPGPPPGHEKYEVSGQFPPAGYE